MSSIKVGVIGATGKMGLETCKAILGAEDMALVCAIGRRSVGTDIGTLVTGKACGVMIEDQLEESLERTKPDVVVDFTNITALRENAPLVLSRGIPMIVGTTGLNAEDRAKFKDLAEAHQTTFFLVANFAIGAVLLMKFSEMAAKYMPHVEIVEMHHDQKKDAPSGTALKTLERIKASRKEVPQPKVEEMEILEGSRGGEIEGIHVHSLRLPGYNAHQEVIFGDIGQTLHIRHDSIHRSSFMPGVLLAIRKIKDYRGFIEDLDTVME